MNASPLYSLRLSTKDVRAIERARGKRVRSEWIREAIRKLLHSDQLEKDKLLEASKSGSLDAFVNFSFPQDLATHTVKVAQELGIPESKVVRAAVRMALK